MKYKTMKETEHRKLILSLVTILVVNATILIMHFSVQENESELRSTLTVAMSRI
jgi:hypothetical protein